MIGVALMLFQNKYNFLFDKQGEKVKMSQLLRKHEFLTGEKT